MQAKFVQYDNIIVWRLLVITWYELNPLTPQNFQGHLYITSPKLLNFN